MAEPGSRLRRLRPLSVAVGIVLVLGAAGIAAALVGFQRYVHESPRFCQNCHEVSPEIAVWVESKHHVVRCQGCHHNTLEEGLHILQVYLTGGVPEGTHAEVDVTTCAGCHASHDKRWPSIANSRGHLIHADKANIPCTRCHGAQMHFDAPPRETCAACHQDKHLDPSHAARHCLACHNFLTTDALIAPTRADCLHCHRTNSRPVLIDPAAPMQLACSACHQPHREPKLVACDRCHKAGELVGLHRQKGHAACNACHPAHSWVAVGEHCYSCHPTARSHHPEQTCVACHTFKKGLHPTP